MQIINRQKSTRSVEGNYMFSCPPRTIYKPISISTSISENNEHQAKRDCSRPNSKAKLARRGNLRRGSRTSSASREFYDPSPAPFEISQVREAPKTVEKQINALVTPIIGSSNLPTKNNVQCQTETPTNLGDFNSFVETTDVGVQIELLQENDNIQFISEQVVAEVIDNAFMDVFSHPEIATKREKLCRGCLDDLHTLTNRIKVDKEEDYFLVTIEAFSKSFLDELIPSLLQKFEDHSLLQSKYGFGEFSSFLPWFLEEFDREAKKLQCLCQRMEKILTR